MILKVLIRLRSHIDIEPNNFTIVCSQDEVVATWVDIDAGDPLAARLIFGHHLLLLKVILEDLHMRASKEMWLRWMERHALDNTFGLSEWPRGIAPAQAMNHHLAGCLNIMSQC